MRIWNISPTFWNKLLNGTISHLTNNKIILTLPRAGFIFSINKTQCHWPTLWCSPATLQENSRKPVVADSEVGSVGCLDRPSSGAAGTNVRQLAAVSGMSVGCLLDGIVIAYSSPAIPSLLAKVKLPSHSDWWQGLGGCSVQAHFNGETSFKF